ncbi:MAG TPA: hypothetical protein ENJ50_01480, partial [Planctomycetaceae bacterium]|nr:hypothetical protein [Planctomycetaceae bacterium]
MKPHLWTMVAVLLACEAVARGRLDVEQLPEYDIRARVVQLEGKDPQQDQTVVFYFYPDRAAHRATGSQWCPWVRIDRQKMAAQLHRYPNTHLRGWPYVSGVRVQPIVDPTRIEVEVRFVENGQVVRIEATLSGPQLGLLLWRRKSDDMPQAASPRQYNQRYWRAFAQVDLPDKYRPKQFPIVDRYIGTDNDTRAWKEGIEALSRAGFTALMVPPSRKLQSILQEAGVNRIAWAVYSPPGYAFDYDEKKVTPEAIERWAQQQADGYRRSGFDPSQMALFAMSDEPGWYYPAMYRALEKSPRAVQRFHEYLRRNGMTLESLGRSDWKQVRPIGPSQVRTSGDRRLFYWTCRFFAWDSARHFATCREALTRAFGGDLPVVTNWNFFGGRFYVSGPVANNP